MKIGKQKKQSRRSSAKPPVIVNTTVATARDARRLARLIVKARLAACAQFMPIRSVYWWKGKMESASEFLLLAKTRPDLVGDLIACIKRHHPYAVPEILATPTRDGWPEYLQWILAETRT